MIPGLSRAADDTHCCGSSATRGGLVDIASLPRAWLSILFSPRPHLGSLDVQFFSDLYSCCITILPLLTKQGLPRASLPSPFLHLFFKKEILLGSGTEIAPVPRFFWAVACFPGLLRSFGYVNRSLGRKTLQTCAHVAMVIHKWTVPSKAFFPQLPMLIDVGMGDKCLPAPDFSSTHLLVASPSLSLPPYLRSQALPGGNCGLWIRHWVGWGYCHLRFGSSVVVVLVV